MPAADTARSQVLPQPSRSANGMVNFLGTSEGGTSEQVLDLYPGAPSLAQAEYRRTGGRFDQQEHAGHAVRRTLFERFFTIVTARKHPTPGAMNHALITNLLAQKPLIGAAMAHVQVLQWTQPQNTQGVAQAVLTGLGGLAHGQSVLQPLSDPYQEG